MSRTASPEIHFVHYTDGKLHRVNPQRSYGLSPLEFQKLLYRKAEFMRNKFEMMVRVRSRIEGELILFRIIVDGD